MPFIIDKETGEEFSKNLVALKKCRKVYAVVFFTYLVAGLFFVLYSFISITSTSWDWLFYELEVGLFSTVVFMLIIDSVIIAPLAFFLAYRGCMKQHDLCAALAPVVVAANYALMIVLKVRHFFDHIPPAFVVVSVYSLLCIAVSVANIRANVKYHWLEQQEGFPQFSERFYEQQEDKFQRGIMDQYEQEVSRLKKTSADAMTDVGSSGKSLEKYEYEHKPSSMDEL